MSNTKIVFNNGQSEITRRDIFFFECKKCHQKRRQTLKEQRAGLQLCRKCRKQLPDPNQTALFDILPDETKKCMDEFTKQREIVEKLVGAEL